MYVAGKEIGSNGLPDEQETGETGALQAQSELQRLLFFSENSRGTESSFR